MENYERFSSWKDHNNTINEEVIRAFHINGDDELYITTDRGVHLFTVEGDCCSHSYFYEINSVYQLIGFKVKDMETVSNELPDIDEYTAVYGYKIHTEGGYGLIVFRNSSNGYYGGSMEYKGLVPEALGKEITEDWNA